MALKKTELKIYCRNEDPKEAMKQIKELKTCFDFVEPTVTEPLPAEEDFKRVCEKTLKKLWKMEPRLKDSKLTKIKKYIDYEYGYSAYRLDLEMDRIFDRFTRILILRIGETIELRLSFMVPRVKSYAYENASNSVPSGQFLSGVI